MHSVVSAFSDVLQDGRPPAHFAKAPGHDGQHAQLLSSYFLVVCRHHWLYVDVLWICELHIAHFILIHDLDEEASTDFEKHSEFEHVLTGWLVRVDSFKVLRVEGGSLPIVLFFGIISQWLRNGILHFASLELLWFIDDQSRALRNCIAVVELESDLRIYGDDELLVLACVVQDAFLVHPSDEIRPILIFTCFGTGFHALSGNILTRSLRWIDTIFLLCATLSRWRRNILRW